MHNQQLSYRITSTMWKCVQIMRESFKKSYQNERKKRKTANKEALLSLVGNCMANRHCAFVVYLTFIFALCFHYMVLIITLKVHDIPLADRLYCKH